MKENKLLKNEKVDKNFSSVNRSKQVFSFKDSRNNILLQKKILKQIHQSTIQRAYNPPNPLPTYQSFPIISNSIRADEVSHTLLSGTRQNGGVPSVNPLGWSWLYSNMDKVKGTWVRFHILNEYLGGPGDNKGNLIPTRHIDNHDANWRRFEEDAKGYNLADETLYFYAKVRGYHNISGISDGFPTGLDAYYTIWDSSSSNWQSPVICSMNFQPPQPSSEGGSLVLYASELTKAQWEHGVGVSSGIANILCKKRDLWKMGYDIINTLEDIVFGSKSESLQSDLEEAEDAIRSALSGRRMKKLTIISG